MVALPTDVGRSGEVARRAFETVFKAMAIAALSISGMIVARTIVDRAHADQLRAACVAVALDLGGWSRTKS